MSVEIIDCQQNTDEWLLARCGIPTASMFQTVMAKGSDKDASLSRRTYLYKLAGEIITGEPMKNYSNQHMARGHEMEQEIRDAYAFRTGLEPQPVGFIRNGRKGASPDSLIGLEGLMEAKSKSPHVLIKAILRNDMPPEHMAQCQGQMWVADRDWCDLVAYWRKMPIFIHRLKRDPHYIAALSREVDKFNAELDEIVTAVRKYGGME